MCSGRLRVLRGAFTLALKLGETAKVPHVGAARQGQGSTRRDQPEGVVLLKRLLLLLEAEPVAPVVELFTTLGRVGCGVGPALQALAPFASLPKAAEREFHAPILEAGNVSAGVVL